MTKGTSFPLGASSCLAVVLLFLAGWLALLYPDDPTLNRILLTPPFLDTD